MSSKKSYMALPSANMPSQFATQLSNFSNNRSDDRMAMLRLEQQDKQFQLNQQRQNRLDSLAQAAVTREEARYQERRTDAENAKLDALRAQVNVYDPISFDTTEDKMGVYGTDNMIDEYDGARMQKALDKTPKMFESKYDPSKDIKKIKLNEENIKIKNAFEDIALNPLNADKNIESLQKTWLKNNGYKDSDEADNDFQKIIKPAISWVADPIEAMFTPWDNVRDYYKVDKDSYEIAKDKIATLAANKEKNKQVDIRNESRKKTEEKRIKDLMDSFKTNKKIKQVKQTIFDTKTTPIDDKVVKLNIARDANNLAQNVYNNKKLSEKERLYELVKISKRRNEALRQYESDKKAAKTIKEFMFKEDYKVTGANKKSEAKSKLAYEKEKKLAADKLNTPKAKQESRIRGLRIKELEQKTN